jgi:hypothetical protein
MLSCTIIPVPTMSALNSQTGFPSDLTQFSGASAAGNETGSKWPSAEDPRWQLALRIAASKSFAKSALLTKFLLYVCERELTGRADEISEQQIGVHVFGRRSDYNPGEDNIVRNYARQLRQRLDHYFEEDGQQESFRIVIPRGGYIPVFSPNAAPPCAPVECPTEESQPVSVEILEPNLPAKEGVADHSGRRLALYGAPVLILVCALIGWMIGQRLRNQNASPSHLLWTQLFDANHPTYIVPADDGIVMFQNLTGHLVPLAEYVDRSYLSMKPPSTVDANNLADLEAQRYTSVTDLNAALRLSALPESRMSHTVVCYARELHMQDLKDFNAILVGSTYSNPWVELFEKNMNFQFNYQATPNASFIRNNSPREGESAIYQNDATAPSHRTYAVIALTHNLNSTGWVLIIEGLTMAGTQAAVDTLFDSHAMQPILEKARNGDGTFRPFEILIETRSFGSNSPQATIVAARLYPR